MYTIYLTIVLLNNSIIHVDKIAYFDNYADCEAVILSDDYVLYLDRRFAGMGIKSKVSICKKIATI